MRFKRVPIKKRSNKKKLRDEAGKIQLQILKLKRGPRCEFCRGPGSNIGRFHIIRVASAPRLEFVEENILLAHWMERCQAHYRWHHYGANAPECAAIEARIKELRGDNYYADLMAREKFMGKHDELYLLARIGELKKELKKLEEK